MVWSNKDERLQYKFPSWLLQISKVQGRGSKMKQTSIMYFYCSSFHSFHSHYQTHKFCVQILIRSSSCSCKYLPLHTLTIFLRHQTMDKVQKYNSFNAKSMLKLSTPLTCVNDTLHKADIFINYCH